MTQNNNSSNFTTIALPHNVIKQIDRFIARNNPHYTSRAHVVKIALNHFFTKQNGDKENETST